MSRRGPGFDFRRFGRALAMQGSDVRHWVSYGTVATADGESGEINVTDPNAVLVTPAGVEVDVVLEPSGYPCTARFGVAAGSCHVNTPIRPGDQVVVGIPDGDVAMVPQVLCVINGSSDPMPLGNDGLPIFRNDRLMIHAGAGIPIEIRTADGTMVRITDGKVEVGGAGVTEQALLGTTYRDAEGRLNSDPVTGLVQMFTLLAAAAVGPLAAFQPGFQGVKAAIQLFEQQSGGFLSDVVKLR